MTEQQSFPITEARMISPAKTSNAYKSAPVTNRVLLYAVLCGLMLGVALGWLRESWDRVFRTSKQVEAVLGKDSIALLPLLQTKKSGRNDIKNAPASEDPRTIVRNHDPAWSVINEPFSRYAEEMRAIKLAID